MELVTNFFKKKSYGFYVTIAVIIMTIVTMIVYSQEYGSVARYMSWEAIWVMGAGLIVALALTIFNLGEWGAAVLAICNFVGLMQYITKIYNYVVVVMVGIDVNTLSSQFITCTVFFAILVVISLANIFFRQEKKKQEEKIA